MRDQVLVTRPEPAAAVTAARLKALGFAPVLAPLLTIEPRRAALPPATSLQAILVTSTNAIPALSGDYHRTPLFAVGDVTAGHARDAGFTCVSSADGDARTLAALIGVRCHPGRGTLLIAAGEGRGADLAAALNAIGFTAAIAEVYAARPATRLPDPATTALRANRLHAALFFSAETARAFVRLAAEAALAAACEAILAVSIGPAATVALEALPWRAVRTAARPTQDEMLKVL